MASQPAKKEHGRTSTGNVILFPGTKEITTESGSYNFPSQDFFDDLGSSLKETMEAIATEAYYRVQFERFLPSDNPFDAVYISLLRPDPVPPDSIEDLQDFSAIEDRSHLLDFDDEWED